MATQLFLRSTAVPVGGSGARGLSTARGTASTTAVTNTTASGTSIPCTHTAGGTAVTWWYQVGAGTISGNITANIRGRESATSANAGVGITVDLLEPDGTTLIGNLKTSNVPSSVTEFSTTDAAKALASTALTSQTATNGCWVRVTLRVVNVGTMGGSQTVTLSYNGASASAAGDSHVTFATDLPEYIPDPITAWGFNEGSGTVAEDLVDSEVITVDSSAWVTGHTSFGLGANSASDFQPMGPSSFPYGRTIMFWLKMDSITPSGAYDYPFVSDQGGGGYEGITVSGSGGGATDISWFGPDSTDLGSAWPDDLAWHHVTLSSTPTHAAIFIDGVQTATGAVISNYGLSLALLNPNDSGTLAPFRGRIDDFRIFDTFMGASAATHWMDIPVAPDLPPTPSAPTVSGGNREFDLSLGAMSGALEYEIQRRRTNLTRPSTTTQASAPAHLRRISQENLPMPSGYTYDFSGAGKRYYNVDTGIRATHNEFEGRYETGHNIAGSWSTDTAENPPFSEGHGTGVAAMAVGATYGVAKGGILVSINAGPEAGPTIAQYEAAATFILANKGDGTVVANFSNGLPTDDLPRTLAFLDSLYLNGVAMFFAAGNSNSNFDAVSWAYRLLGVGASTQADAKASYSDYGTGIDLYAPISPTTTAGSSSNSATRAADGTSEASPTAAAVGMKILEGNPHLSPARLYEVLRSQAWVNKITGAGSADNRLLNGQSNTDLWFSRSVGTTLTPTDDGYGDAEEYEYQYRYRTSSGWSDWSPSSTAVTDPPPAVLILEYGFNEGSGSTSADSSGNARTATVAGWTASGKTSAAALGTAGNAASHTGSLGTLPAFTVMQWMYPTDWGDSTIGWQDRGTGIDAWGIGWTDSTHLTCWVYGTALAQPVSSVTTPMNAWVHVAMTVGAGTITLYINGVSRGTASYSGTIRSAVQGIDIGGTTVWGDSKTLGRFDEVRVFDGALSSGEITTWMNTPIGSAGTPFLVGTQPVTGIYVGSSPVISVYRGGVLVWSST